MSARRGTAALILLIVTVTPACKERRRRAVLEAIVEEREAAAYQELATRCRALTEAAGKLAEAPAQATLAAARDRWKEALLGWSETFAFRPAGLVALAPHLHATYWPIEPKLVQKVLAGTEPIDARFVADLGVSAKGMYALEYLLFGAPKDPTDPLAALQAPDGARRRAYLRALADGVAADARAAAAVISDSGFATTFATEGQAALNRLVNDIYPLLEGVLTERLTFVMNAADAGSLGWIQLQGRPSGSSLVIAQGLLRGVARTYRPGPGHGLSRLVRAASSEADDAVRAALDRALGSVDALGAPLEVAVVRDRAAVARAIGDVRALEVAFKTNVASALGVTLTFTAGDSD